VELLNHSETITARTWEQRRQPATLSARSRTSTSQIHLQRLQGRGFHPLDVTCPVAAFTVVTGRSGTGNTSLVMEGLKAAVLAMPPSTLSSASMTWTACELETPLTVVEVDQTPLTRSPRSTVVTWLKAWDEIRTVFAETAEARQRGWTAAQFSYH